MDSGSWTVGTRLLLAGFLVAPAPQVLAQQMQPLAIAVGEPGSASHEIGAGLRSGLLQRAPAGGPSEVELWASLTPYERVTVLLEEVQFAVAPPADGWPDDPELRAAVRAIAGLSDGNQVLVRSSLDDETVYQVTRMIFEDDTIAGAVDPRAAREWIDVDLHPGAARYYDEQTAKVRTAAVIEEPAAATAEAPQATPIPPKSYTVLFGFDDRKLVQDQIKVVAEACRYASTLPSARFILAGYADTLGPDDYNDRLSLGRAQSVAAAIRNDPRFSDAFSVIQFGEKELAVPTADETGEPRNRRVVITVTPGDPG